MPLESGRELVVFDFDETIVNCNSDTYIDELSPNGSIPEQIITDYYDHSHWTQYMRQVFVYLHKCEVTQDDYERRLKTMPFVDGMKDLLLNIKNSVEFEAIIISDANSFFIGLTIETHSLDKTFRKVFTNPAKFDGNGCLLIEEYHHQNWCDISANNLCKGYVLQEYLRKRREEDGVTYSRVSYVGDGQNDVCPSLTLNEGDRVFARNGYSLHKRLTINKELKAQLFDFTSGRDIWNVLNGAVSDNNSEEDSGTDVDN